MSDSSTEPFQITLARQIAPELWALLDEGIVKGGAANVLVEPSLKLAQKIEPFLIECGLAPQQLETAGDALTALSDILEDGHKMIEKFKASSRGELNSLIAKLQTISDDLSDLRDEIICSHCNEWNNDGDGFDGLCGDCADRAEKADDLEANDQTQFGYSSLYLDDEDKYRGVLTEAGKIRATTPLLYKTRAAAVEAVREQAQSDAT